MPHLARHLLLGLSFIYGVRLLQLGWKRHKDTESLDYRPLQYPAGRNHNSRAWRRVFTDWSSFRRFVRKFHRYVLESAAPYASIHRYESCSVCNRGDDVAWLQFVDIVREARTGCQLASYLEQIVLEFCDPSPAEKIELVLLLTPNRGRVKVKCGSPGPEGWGDFEIYVLEDINNTAGLPADLMNLKPLRNAYFGRELTQRLAFMRKQMESCCSLMNICTAVYAEIRKKYFPKRVLRIIYDQQAILVRLQEDTEMRETGPYTCLSYCWGGEQRLRLTSDSEVQLRDGVSIHKLPRTLCEAVMVAHALGIEYIWIDALCIFQDNRQDWHAQASDMARIYGGAAFTICASSACSADSGFLSDSDSDCTLPLNWAEPLPLKSIDNVNVNQIWARPANRHDTGGNWWPGTQDYRPHARRAWTFQEDLLSIRCLRFEEEEIVWECLEGFRCECEEGPWQASSYLLPGQMMAKVYYYIQSEPTFQAMVAGVDDGWNYHQAWYFVWFWHHLIEHFFSRQLTYDEDRLVALEGVANTFKWRCSEYYAGIWGIKPHWSLAWQCQKLFEGLGGEDYPRRPSRYRAPSWSWASVESDQGKGRLGHPSREPLPVAEVLNITWQGIRATTYDEGHDTLTLFTFVFVQSRAECNGGILKTLVFDTESERTKAGICDAFWLVALGKEETNDKQERFRYQVLLCEELEGGRLRRMGISHEVPHLDGYWRQTVQLI